MASQAPINPSLPDYTQLTQVRIPLDRAAEAFATRDSSGRIPIVVIPERAVRIPSEFLIVVGIIVLAGLLGGNAFQAVWPPVLGVVAGLAVLGFVSYKATRVLIPEGVNALLAQGGKYTRTIGSGVAILPPWAAVTHLVTRREIPFAVPVEDAPTQDNVRALLHALVTFSITDPHHFVYNISADDFDLVFQAVCQGELRAMVRGIPSDKINDLPLQDLTPLRQSLSKQVEPYGVTIMKVSITVAQPPLDFTRSQEARQLATFQQSEQKEQHTLAAHRQADEDALMQQRILAQVERDHALLCAQTEQATVRRQIIELEAQADELRLARLEERLRKFPHAARREWQAEQVAVLRALAGNARAILQVGNTDGFLRAWLMQDSLVDKESAAPPASSPQMGAAPETSDEH